MSAAARARLAGTAHAVAALRGGWRAAALYRVRDSRRALGFTDLAEAPDWLCWPEADRAALAWQAALAHLAPRIARTLDGAVLGALVAVVGAPALEWACGMGEGIDFAPALVREEADGLDALGNALLMGYLSPTLAEEVAPAFAPGPPVAPEAAASAVALALEAWPQPGSAA